MTRLRTLLFALLALALAATPVAAGHRHGERHVYHRDSHDGRDFDLDADWLRVTHDDHRGEEVAISAAGDLEVDGRAVRVGRAERRLLADYHGQYAAILESAESIGEEAAAVGVAGAAVGVRAVSKVLKRLDEDYDEEDLEREMELEEAKLEQRAAKLEAWAEEIEALAEEFEETGAELRDRIPALRELGWF